ncbi:AgrD family cyclic lactone autoinducer peptide [Acutalibacter muris]|jgi:cyclic lactone autoinducer peptide|nr:cyclic lactone autoinducer peptide [Acutalibacter muris]
MMSIWSIIAKLIESVASFGAGAASAGYGYEPEVPEELQK